jgi:N-acetylmuramoyl-L-alanine amidase
MRRRAVLLLPAVLLAGCASFAGAATSAATSASTSASMPPSSPPTTAPSPTTSAPAARTPVSRVVVVLDPGHNGGNAAHPALINAPVPDGAGGTKPCNTTGTATDAGYPEHAFTWDVALRTRELLAAHGVTVVLTRQDDTGVGPCVDARARVPGRVGAAAFVGIHGDGAAPAGHGFHVITSSLQRGAVAAGARTLAVRVRDAVRAVEPVSTYLGHDGLDVRSDLAGLNLNPVPAIYLECGNMRNASDAAWMSSRSGRQAIAARIAAGVLGFLGR